MEIRCPHCDRILKDYEIKSRWCNTCNKPIGNTEIEEETISVDDEIYLTTGFDFQGYRILRYLDVYSDEMVLEKHFLNSLGKESFIIDNINSLKNTLKDKIKRKATENGANALIGVTFEISGIADILVISMTATAVVIEPITDDSGE